MKFCYAFERMCNDLGVQIFFPTTFQKLPTTVLANSLLGRFCERHDAGAGNETRIVAAWTEMGVDNTTLQCGTLFSVRYDFRATFII